MGAAKPAVNGELNQKPEERTTITMVCVYDYICILYIYICFYNANFRVFFTNLGNMRLNCNIWRMKKIRLWTRGLGVSEF